MSDIVGTIQAEQDRIIRADLPGVLVVQGGPGTGKTAVALHRAAYLLYTHRERLARSGVLIVGPNPTFLRYIAQVLPALGETGVVLSTIGELFRGGGARRRAPEVGRGQGRRGMADVLAAAVRDRQRCRTRPWRSSIDGRRCGSPADRRGADRARRPGKPHNAAGRPSSGS